MATQFLDYKIPIGLFKQTTRFIQGHFSARKWFREILKWLHVPYYDCSCPTDQPDSQPVRFNGDTDVLERFDNTEWVPVTGEAVAVSGFTGTINGTDGDFEFENGVLVNFTPA
jgi:hypothetical protein